MIANRTQRWNPVVTWYSSDLRRRRSEPEHATKSIFFTRSYLARNSYTIRCNILHAALAPHGYLVLRYRRYPQRVGSPHP